MESHETEQPNQDPPPAPRKKRRRWLAVISILANVVLIVAAVGLASGAAVLHETDTNPNFCANCHIMQPNVDSYLTSNHLDHVHAEAGVQCKDCHSDYSIPDEIVSGIHYLTGDYELDEDGLLPKREFDDSICTQCHVSLENVAQQTDFLYYNPHTTTMGSFTCNTCHQSHGDQFDQCNVCHYNGDQRMIENTEPRPEQLAEDIPYIPW